MDKCLECQAEFDNEVELHRHLRSHKLKIEDYYFKHFPRFDKSDGSLIRFKSKQFYFTHDFNTRTNFRRWLSKQDNVTLRAYCIDFLKRRKEYKKLTYAPCQVELRSLECLSIIGLNKIFKDSDYYKIAFQLGYIVQHEPLHLAYPSSLVYEPKDGIIWIDTREQNPLTFQVFSQLTTLSVGDYAFGTQDKKLPVVFERKSISDFISSFGRDYERVKKEMKRGVATGAYIVVIVECDMKYALVFNYLPSLPQNIQVTPEFVFHNVRECCQEFPSVQFLFVKNRLEASRLIEKIFLSKGDLTRFDLQLAYDMNLI